MIPVKSDKEIEVMRKGGKILSLILEKLTQLVKSGLSTQEIDDLALKLMNQRSVRPAFKNYRGFAGNICTSLNEEVVHGIPDKNRLLKEGDIVSIDIGIVFDDFYSDAAFTLPVGNIAPEKKKLIKVTHEALEKGINQARVNNYLSDISCAIQRHVEKNRFSVVRDFVGHGIGRQLHEEPQIANFGPPHQGPVLKKGMVFAIEPMVNMGTWEVEISKNGWTAKTKDGLPSAHFEHTVAITEDGPEILTI